MPENAMKKLKRFILDHSLVLIFVLLFIAFLIGQALAGATLYNETLANHGLAQVGYWQYVCTGNFLQGMFANWQAAILQLGSLIIFGIFLRERGAAHSIEPGKPVKPGKTARRSLWPRESAKHRAEMDKSAKTSGKSKKAPSGKIAFWIYCNSLSLAFMLLFLVTFVLHLLSGAAAYNEQRALTHQTPLSIGAFFVSSKFWFSTFQTWEAEYMAIALFIFLTVFLRQEGSPESKPVGTSNATTGETNK